MSRPSLSWYARRLRRMSPAELAWRTRDQLRRIRWRARQVRPGAPPGSPQRLAPVRRFTAVLPAGAAAAVPADARKAIVETADGIMAGRFELLGVVRTDLQAPDWFLDPVTARRSDPARYAFRINHRSEAETGNVKQVWELSRQHHLTVLAAAWYLTGNDKYAQRVAEQLRSWWRENPFLSGVHWTNGIEVGVRLISWTWVRRLLDGWPQVADLFERDELALRQIRWHQQYLAAFRSRGSSANNHVIAEAAGQLVASCTLPWFEESRGWRDAATAVLARELDANTFPDGLNRELASDYHRFVAELALLAAVEADAAGEPLGATTWSRLTAMLDAAAAVVDQTVRPPRQGDGDDGRALLLDPADSGSWSAFLALGGAVLGARPWWPHTSGDATSVLVSSLTRRSPVPAGQRPASRPARFADAGMTLLRTVDDAGPEIWCRCDAGPHGFLAIAAHAHADALSVEVRVGGVDILADPGTYCYHGEQRWRSYFRSTLGHNTVELAGRSQSAEGGPFLWLGHAATRVLDVGVDDTAGVVHWSAEHDGYLSLSPPARHRRTVRLDRKRRVLQVTDHVASVGRPDYGVRLAYHLGPEVEVELAGATGHLRWHTGAGAGSAVLELPEQLRWGVHRGAANPVLGWYSPRFGHRVPACTLLGSGPAAAEMQLRTVVRFATSKRPA